MRIRPNRAAKQRSPSWVPDWSVGRYVAVRLTVVDQGRSDLQNATHYTTSEVQSSADKDILLLSGHTVDLIADIAGVLWPLIDDVDRAEMKAEQGKTSENSSTTKPPVSSLDSYLRVEVRKGFAGLPASVLSGFDQLRLIRDDFASIAEDLEWWIDSLECFVKWDQLAKSVHQKIHGRHATTSLADDDVF